MNSFVYDIPTKVYFGENQLSNLGAELEKLGKKVLLTYGGGSIKKIGLYDKVMAELSKGKFEVHELSGVEPNPKVESMAEGAKLCKDNSVDVILAVGGGSVIDCSKAIGQAALYDGNAWDLVSGKAKVNDTIPVVSILTLSATGSEMNVNAVISNMTTNEKIGMKTCTPPVVSFLDPTLTYSVSKYQTACGAVDIISHIFEVYFNNGEGLFMVDKVAEDIIKTVIKYAPIALENPSDYEARANLMWSSSWALNGFLKCGKPGLGWTCHPIEHELSAHYDITHGLGLAILTPRWLEICFDKGNIDKICQFGINVFDIDSKLDKKEIARKAIDMLTSFFFDTLGLDSTLSKIDIDNSKFEVMADSVAGKVASNVYQPLTKEEVIKLFEMCL